MIALIFNPGSNSLKFELLDAGERQKVASDAAKLISVTVDEIGKQPKLNALKNGELAAETSFEAKDMREAVRSAIDWLRRQQELREPLKNLTYIGVRVVHGGTKFESAMRVDDRVVRDIEALEELAPLHNRSALDVLARVAEELPAVPRFAAFDTVFHRTLPECSWRYPIDRETADRHGIRKYGFHGISHRYMMEQFAHLAQKPIESLSLVTLHLESGCSACAISQGRSIDTTMGMTPLEGLMMGTRSGSVDPAILPYLMRKESFTADEALSLLNKRSGLLGIAGGTLDTRELVKRQDEAAKLALAMFAYRVRLAVGSYLAALGDAEALIFGGGIGEDSPWLRESVCESLAGWGVHYDREVNAKATKGTCRISTDKSRLQVWAMPAEECLQIAHECLPVFLAA